MKKTCWNVPGSSGMKSSFLSKAGRLPINRLKINIKFRLGKYSRRDMLDFSQVPKHLFSLYDVAMS